MPTSVKALMERYCPTLSVGRYGRVYKGTSEFMNITCGDVIELEGLHYLVLRDEVERSYSIEDPKYWVKRCQVMETGDSRILKLVFLESFTLNLGQLAVRCYRSPEKEARILRIVDGDRRFMQGFSVKDEEGNVVRVLEVIRGRRLDIAVDRMDLAHREYFFEAFPDILEKFIGACEAIAFLHAKGELHGDIRRDHLWLEPSTGRYRWIDFDYTYDWHENPFGLDVLGLGGLLIFLAGKGIYTYEEAAALGVDEETWARIPREDFSLLFKNRLVNLRHLFPYIPEELNRVLRHFSLGAPLFYEDVEEFLAELRPCVDLIRKGGGRGL